MSALSWATHHRLWTMGMGLALLVVAVAAGLWFFVLRSPGTPFDVKQALRLYRHDQHAGGLSARLPRPGVYRYRTTGGEQLSVGGIDRSFPSDTEMVVTDDGCAHVQWEPLEQHIEGLVVCPTATGGLAMTSATSDEVIAGVHTTDLLHCSDTTYLLPPDPVPGTTWHSACSATHLRINVAGKVMGAGTVTVGGHRMSALHTRIVLTFSGEETGTNPTDYWLAPGDGLILREQEEVKVAQKVGPLGAVRYGEHMTVALASTTPSV